MCFPTIVGLAVNGLFVLCFAIVFIAGAFGDILVAWRLRKENPRNTVLDHPLEAGYIVYEND